MTRRAHDQRQDDRRSELECGGDRDLDLNALGQASPRWSRCSAGGGLTCVREQADEEERREGKQREPDDSADCRASSHKPERAEGALSQSADPEHSSRPGGGRVARSWPGVVVGNSISCNGIHGGPFDGGLAGSARAADRGGQPQAQGEPILSRTSRGAKVQYPTNPANLVVVGHHARALWPEAWVI